MRRAERIAACTQRHTSAVGGWFPGDDEYLELVFMSNGQPMLKAICRSCTNGSSAIPQALWREWRLYCAGPLNYRLNRSYDRDPCRVRDCDSTDTEYHHFAPRNTFGMEADDWPCLPVCRTHHREWHTRMDGYRWHARRVDVA